LAGLALVVLAGCDSSSVSPSSASSGTLRVAINPGFVPFEQVEGGTLNGFDVDLARELAHRLGRKDATFEQMPFTSLLSAVTSKRNEVAISGILDTPKRREEVAFSKPYIYDTFVISVKSSNNSVKGQGDLTRSRLAVQVGTIPEEFVRTKLPQATIVTAQDTPSAFQLVDQGRADAVITDAPVAGYYVKKFGGNLKVLPTPLNQAQPIAVVLPLHSVLQQKVDAALDAMEADGTLGNLRRTWFGSPDLKSAA
jgi:polar amino acid transport system substrate-binding protein